MHSYTLSHLSDVVLLRDLVALVAHDRVTTATLLAHIAEVDARRLYVPAGHPSMHAYCVEELRLSEDSAYKRIRAARAARQFPALFDAVAEGRLHLAAVCLLAPHLTPENADELIEAATHRPKSEIEEMLARGFPCEAPPTVRTVIRPIPQLAPGRVAGNGSGACRDLLSGRAGGDEVGAVDDSLAPGRVESAQGTPEPPAPEGYVLQLTIGKSTHDKLRYAQALLSHAIPSGDLAQVLDRALDALIAKVEKRKLGTTMTGRPRAVRTSARKRHVPAHVRRAVWERDQGQCTFASATGHRCNARRFLEFDHADPVARGGRATVEGIRLRCRAHNQYEAERMFGAGYMRGKREAARHAAEEARARHAAAEARAQVEARARAEAKEQALDVLAGLRSLGCRTEEARRAVELTEPLHDVTLEERMRAALQLIGRRVIQARSGASPRSG